MSTTALRDQSEKQRDERVGQRKRTDLVGYVGWHGNFFLLDTVHIDDASSVTIPRRVYSRGECQIVTRNFAIATGLPLAPVPSRASRKLC